MFSLLVILAIAVSFTQPLHGYQKVEATTNPQGFIELRFRICTGSGK